MNVVSIVGARPQFVKCAALSRELRTECHEVIVHTGQHYDNILSDVFFEELEIPRPDYHLGIGSGTHGYQIGRMLMDIEQVLQNEKPDLVLVHGDTNTTIAGALAASKLHIRLGHVEAGLRYHDRDMPEEINRIVTDHCSDLLFCPTKTSVNHLHEENVNSGVYLTGDVMVDILLRKKEIAERSSVLETNGLESGRYIVVTVHRAGNTDSREHLANIIEALRQVEETVVFPIHPRTARALETHGLRGRLEENENVKVINPLAYLDFLKLMNHARLMVTDSGCVQKEAYVLKVPVITLLESTGWDETVEDGWNIPVGTDTKKISAMINDFDPRCEQTEDFGSGQACRNIVRVLVDELK